VTEPKVSTAIANLLFVLFLVFFSVSIALGAFIYFRHQQTAAELARLSEEVSHAKSRQELQVNLMKGNNRTAVYPHADPRVGFVLNPAIRSTAMWAENAVEYNINSIGLRGKNIETKAPGVIRIALVSDSWFFGWRLSDNDRLESALTRLLASHYPASRYEVITVAIPGWNVENEAAFLEDHYSQLQPDILVWAINPNDLWDSASVVPPGLVAETPARGSAWLCPQTNIQWTLSGAPVVLERWRRNIELMKEISESYHVPILALHVHEYEPYVSMIRMVGAATFPIVATPLEYQKDPRWSVEPGVDSHPTAWATDLMAIDLLGHLVEHGHLPATEFSETEKEVIAKGQNASRGMPPERIEGFLNQTYGIPTTYARTGAYFRNSAITPKWDVCPQGRLSVGRESGTNTAEISFSDVKNDTDGGNKLSCSVRTRDGRSYVGEGLDKANTRVCRVSIPPSQTPGIVDIYWQFKKFSCENATDCFAAKFESASVF
jgi:hypothetical protein